MKHWQRVAVAIAGIVVLVPLGSTGHAIGAASSPASGLARGGQRLPAIGDRGAARVLESGMFVFHSDFWFNLHDFLYWRAQGDDAPDAGECAAGLEAERAQAWADAEAYYAAEMADRNPRTDDLMRTLRFSFAPLDAPENEPEAAAILDLLRDVAPIYASCWWSDHDARNRDWIATLGELLERHGRDVAERLTALYVDPWPEEVPVDVVGYSNWAGANTTGVPVHMLVSSADPDILGPSSLEIVFHEASHGVLGVRSGTITRHVRDAYAARGTEPPRDLWHAILFYTSGRATQEAVAGADFPDYDLYMFRGDVFGRFHDLLLQHWQPYIEGAVDLPTAAANLASASE